MPLSIITNHTKAHLAKYKNKATIQNIYDSLCKMDLLFKYQHQILILLAYQHPNHKWTISKSGNATVSWSPVIPYYLYINNNLGSLNK